MNCDRGSVVIERKHMFLPVMIATTVFVCGTPLDVRALWLP